MESYHSPLTLEIVLQWARSGHESDKVYRFLFLHPEDFFTIPNKRIWSIAHQVIYNGDVDLLKRILALYSDDQIDIHTKTKDNKTLLDVAKEQRTNYPLMYTYIEHLFLQDDLIQAAKKSDWRLVRDILKKNPELTNEKPPYSTYFLLHYVIQNGDKTTLEDLLRRFQFQIDVLSADNETPIVLAKRLKKVDMYSILETTRQDQPLTNQITYSPPSLSIRNVNTLNERPKCPAPIIPSVKPSSSTASVSSTLPYPKIDPFPPIGFGNLLLEITSEGSYIFSTENISTSIPTEPPQSEQQTHTTTQLVNTTKATTNQYPKANLEPSSLTSMTPITPTSKAQLMKNLTCTLTQKIFIHPVIASDGQTYEREAIAEFVSLYHCSPITGAPMEPVFKDNTEIKKIIQSMRK